MKRRQVIAFNAISCRRYFFALFALKAERAKCFLIVRSIHYLNGKPT
jgi:hypothetical protein